MCKRVTVTGLALLMLALSVAAVSADTPFVGVYFDEQLQTEQANCPGMGVRDTLWVAASNFDALLGAIQFQIFYPSMVFWFADFNILTEDDGGLVLGDTPSGISIGFPFPENFNLTRLVLQVDFFWNCATPCEFTNQQIQVCCVEGSKHPGFELVQGVGLTALICATVPTEQSTWGNIKSLYEGE